VAAASRSAHELDDDLPPPNRKMTASVLEALFPDTAGAPALTASMAAFFWDCLPPNSPPKKSVLLSGIHMGDVTVY